MANNRDFKGVWIPKEVWLDERLSALDKVILVEIDSLDNDEKGCFASNKYLAEFCQCSETKISNTIQKLSKLKYIEVKSFDGRLRKIQSRLTKSVRQNNKKCKAAIQKLQDNNIDNNKNNNKDYKIDAPAVASTSEKPKNSSIRKTKKEKSLDRVIGKLQEYEFSEKVENKILEFYEDRIEKKDYPAENQLTMTLDKLASVSEKKQLQALDNSISNGYKGIFLDSKKDEYDGIHIRDISQAEIDREKEKYDEAVKKGDVFTY